MKPIHPATYSAEYFERGKANGISCYENYRWLPDLTIPMVRSIVLQLGIHKGQTILDFGCAKGYVVKAFRALGFNAWGCDVSEYALECADAETRERLCLMGIDGTLPKSDRGAWDWIIAKDVLEHLTHDQIDFTLAEFCAKGRNVFAVVPLGDGSKFIIPDMEHDATHVSRESLAWWSARFYRHGFTSVNSFHVMPGVKENWTGRWPTGNGFFIAA